jgi:hypothetical protein
VAEKRHLLGIHIGRGSLRARLLAIDGTPAYLLEKRFAGGDELGARIKACFLELARLPQWGSLASVSVGLGKEHRHSLPEVELRSLLPAAVPLLTLPAQQAVLLGALPSGPSLSLSLGAELRLAAVDATHVYQEYRFQEGGGLWWTEELLKLSEHSPRLTRSLAGLGDRRRILRALPRLLEGADFPAPDPVLKVRVDSLSSSIAESCLGLSTRLPGIRVMTMAGFLHPSPLSRRVSQACSGYLRQQQARFPAEVGAALLGLALHLENEERRHLGKPPEDGRPSRDRWTASPTLVRRLFRTRRPFPDFPVDAR